MADEAEPKSECGIPTNAGTLEAEGTLAAAASAGWGTPSITTGRGLSGNGPASGCMAVAQLVPDDGGSGRVEHGSHPHPVGGGRCD
jgi:hypothetical protein